MDWLVIENSGTVISVVLFGIVSALLLYIITKKESKYPPGPLTLPFIGNLHQVAIAGSVDKFIQANRKKYGNIFTIEFAGCKRVVVSGYENFHKLLVKNSDHTSSRCPESMGQVIKEVIRHSQGMVWSPYPHWKSLRSLTLLSMKEDGMGKTVMEDRINEEIREYIEHFVKPNHRSPIEISHSMQQATCNIIAQLLYARRFDYDDKTFNLMISSSEEMFYLGGVNSVAENIPTANIFMRSSIERERHLINNVEFPIMRKYLEEVRERLDSDNPVCVLDRFLIQAQQVVKQEEKCFTDENALLLSLELYTAGSETTSAAIRWALLYMCLNPSLQSRVHSEIDKQIGQDRGVAYKDKTNMPLTEAILLETFRISNIAPHGLPRLLDTEIEVDGKVLPAGVDLMFNFASVLHDETVFEEPHLFNPDRYLEGDITLKKQRTIPFSMGKRACIGESLARMEFFMFFVTFLQLYNVRLPEGSSTDTSAVKSLVVQSPPKYKLVFEPRL